MSGIKGLGKTIKKYRLLRRLSKSHLARIVDCHRSTILRIENNERYISEWMIPGLERALKIKIKVKNNVR